jgi:hypothetical protein
MAKREPAERQRAAAAHTQASIDSAGLRHGCGCRNLDRNDKKCRDVKKVRLRHHTDSHVACPITTNEMVRWLGLHKRRGRVSCDKFHDCLFRITSRDLACERRRALRLAFVEGRRALKRFPFARYRLES